VCSEQPEHTVEARLEGLVIGHRGNGLLVEMQQGTSMLCHTRRRLGCVAVGDKVVLKQESGNSAVVERILPRHSLLLRPGAANRQRVFAANVDTLCIVTAPEPAADFLLIDQCLVVCEQNGITAQLIFNKIDLLVEADFESFQQTFKIYVDIGYQIIETSIKNGQGIKRLEGSLRHHVSVLTGQSGVGKSSLTSVLLAKPEIRVGSLSEASGHGKHTTTSATLYHLPSGGDLIDSPGLAVFGLVGISQQQLAWGYREFRPYIERCRFNDCKHHLDKGCAVIKAVESGELTRQRYQRYLKLFARITANE